MQQPVQLRFIGMAPSPAIEATARQKAARLDRLRPDLVACRVTVELVDRRRHPYGGFSVRVTAAAPGQELAAIRIDEDDAFVALREAFDAVLRQLQDPLRSRAGRTGD